MSFPARLNRAGGFCTSLHLCPKKSECLLLFVVASSLRIISICFQTAPPLLQFLLLSFSLLISRPFVHFTNFPNLYLHLNLCFESTTSLIPIGWFDTKLFPRLNISCLCLIGRRGVSGNSIWCRDECAIIKRFLVFFIVFSLTYTVCVLSHEVECACLIPPLMFVSMIGAVVD
jgi:hypothetical protein